MPSCLSTPSTSPTIAISDDSLPTCSHCGEIIIAEYQVTVLVSSILETLNHKAFCNEKCARQYLDDYYSTLPPGEVVEVVVRAMTTDEVWCWLRELSTGRNFWELVE